MGVVTAGLSGAGTTGLTGVGGIGLTGATVGATGLFGVTVGAIALIGATIGTTGAVVGAIGLTGVTAGLVGLMGETAGLTGAGVTIGLTGAGATGLTGTTVGVVGFTGATIGATGLTGATTGVTGFTGAGVTGLTTGLPMGCGTVGLPIGCGGKAGAGVGACAGSLTSGGVGLNCCAKPTPGNEASAMDTASINRSPRATLLTDFTGEFIVAPLGCHWTQSSCTRSTLSRDSRGYCPNWIAAVDSRESA